MTKITISYRREDSGPIAGRIFDRLVAHYGADTVFRDIDNIPPGLDFRKYINNALDTTDILLAIVGPQWAGRTGDGRVRIQEPTDLVRLEVETALRKDIVVIPVLVGNAMMPQPDDLPQTLQDFAFRNAVKVDALEDFDNHVRRLIKSMDRLIDTQRAAEQNVSPPPLAAPAPPAANEGPVETRQVDVSRQAETRRDTARRNDSVPEGEATPASQPTSTAAHQETDADSAPRLYLIWIYLLILALIVIGFFILIESSR